MIYLAQENVFTTSGEECKSDEKAVAYLEPLMALDKDANDKSVSSKPTILMATVKGDVHDIGKILWVWC